MGAGKKLTNHHVRKKWLRTLELVHEAAEFREGLKTEEPIRMDTNYVFQIYATFCGDVERTAAACGLNAVDVLHMAREDDWNTKLESIIKLKKSGKPGDVERAISRALNFVQAHRMRLFLDRVVTKLTNFSDEEVLKYMMVTTTSTSKDGTVHEKTALNARPFADLTASLEKVHHMLYMALADSASERDKRREAGGDEASAEDIHTAIADAMAKVGGSGDTVKKALMDAQLAQAQERIAQGALDGTAAPNGAPIPDFPKFPSTKTTYSGEPLEEEGHPPQG